MIGVEERVRKMIIRELIEKLQALPPDMSVLDIDLYEIGIMELEISVVTTRSMLDVLSIALGKQSTNGYKDASKKKRI